MNDGTPHLTALPVEALLRRFADGTGSPAAGSALALTGSLAASMLETIAQKTREKASCAAFHERAEQIRQRSEQLGAALLSGVQHDADTVEQMIAHRRSRDAARTEGERAHCVELERRCLVPCTELPLGIATQAIELASFAAELAAHGARSTQADARVAGQLALTVTESALYVASINLPLLKSEEFSLWAGERREEMRAASAALERARAALAL